LLADAGGFSFALDSLFLSFVCKGKPNGLEKQAF